MNGNGAAASYGDLLMTSLLVLVAVCVAAFVVVRLAGRFLSTGRARGAHLLDIVARLPLEPRRSLYVVEVAGKTLLVGTSEMGLSVLSELDASEVRARAVARPTFADLVRNALRRRTPPDSPISNGSGDAPPRDASVVSPSDDSPSRESSSRESSPRMSSVTEASTSMPGDTSPRLARHE